MKPAELPAEALKLDSRSRAEVAHRLLESLDDLSEEELENLWLDEAERRDRALDAGGLEPIPAEKVFADARSRLK